MIQDEVRRLARVAASAPERRLAAEMLGALGPVAREARPALVERSIVDPEPLVRYAALSALARIGWDADAAVPELAALLEHDDEIAQARAAWALGRIGPAAEPAVPALARVIADDGRLIDPRWSAAVALERLEGTGRQAAPVLAASLSDADADLREAAARALAAVAPGAETAALLMAALDDPDHLVRESAAVGLGRLDGHGARAVGALRARLADPWPTVPLAAADALAALAPGEEVPASGVDGAPRPEVARALQERLEGLRSPAERTRQISTFEIGKLGPEAAAAVPLLAELLPVDANLDVRWSAAWSLGRMGPAADAAVPALLRGLVHDLDPDVRGQIAWALGRHARLGGEWRSAIVAGLAAALRDEDSLVREEAAMGLGGLGPAALPARSELAARAADRHPLVRLRARRALMALEPA